VFSGYLLFCFSGCNNHDVGPQPVPRRSSPESPALRKNTCQGVGSKILIEGIVYDQHSPLVIINGQLLSEGDTVAGLKIVEISSSSVAFEDLRSGLSITKKFPQKHNQSFDSSQKPKTSFSFAPAQEIETSEELLYLPSRIAASQKYPLLIVLPADGMVQAVLDYLRPICEKHKWIMLVSKKFRAGIDMRPVIDNLASRLNNLSSDYPIDRKRVVVTGFSAGATGAHFFSWSHSEAVSAVIVNSGMIHKAFRDGKRRYPRQKYAVFLASPTDFQYQQMQDDRRFLERSGWQVKWIEFKGGHTLAPLPAYEEAVQWLKMKLD